MSRFFFYLHHVACVASCYAFTYIVAFGLQITFDVDRYVCFALFCSLVSQEMKSMSWHQCLLFLWSMTSKYQPLTITNCVVCSSATTTKTPEASRTPNKACKDKRLTHIFESY